MSSRKFSLLGLAALTLATIALIVSCTLHLDIVLRPQQTDMWCWAASGQMIMEHINPGLAPNQCQQANNRFGFNDCCNNPTPTHCVRGGWPEFARYGFDADRTSWTALDKATLQAQVIRNQPVAFTWYWNGGGGHMMVAHGYQYADSVAGTPDMVEVSDPWAPNVGDHRWITYDAYVSGETYTHWDDFYNITD